MTNDHINKLRRQNNWQAIVGELSPACVEGQEGWNEPEALSTLGFALTQLNDLAKAKDIYMRWIEVEPDRPQPFYCLGYVFYIEENWREALRWFDEALRIFPDYIVCLYRKGYALYAFDKSRKAVEPLQHALALFDALNEGQFKKSQQKNAMKILFTLARAHHRNGNNAEALELLERLLREDEKQFIQMVHKRYALGKVLAALNREADALAQLNQALDKRFPQPFVLDQIGRVYHQMGDYKTALKYYDQALVIRRLAFVLNNRAQTFLALEKTGLAVRDLHESLKRDKLGKHKTYLELAKISLQQNQLVEAKNYIDNAIHFKQQKYGSDCPEAHYLMVFYHLQKGEKNAAKESLRYALHLNPELQWDDSLKHLVSGELTVG